MTEKNKLDYLKKIVYRINDINHLLATLEKLRLPYWIYENRKNNLRLEKRQLEKILKDNGVIG